MKAKQIQELSNNELMSKLVDLKKEMFNLRFSHATGQLSNPMQMVICKKDIARVKTIMRERELTEEAKAKKKAEDIALKPVEARKSRNEKLKIVKKEAKSKVVPAEAIETEEVSEAVAVDNQTATQEVEATPEISSVKSKPKTKTTPKAAAEKVLKAEKSVKKEDNIAKTSKAKADVGAAKTE